jgi:hypothetical protein
LPGFPRAGKLAARGVKHPKFSNVTHGTVNRIRQVRLRSRLAALRASTVIGCFTGLLLFFAPVAFVAPIRAAEVNNTLPAEEEETKSSSSVNAAHNQIRQRTRHATPTFMPVLRATCVITSSRARTTAPDGLSEHAHREGLGTPLRC